MKEELKQIVEEFIQETSGKWTGNKDGIYDMPSFADFAYWITQGKMPHTPYDDGLL